MAYLYNLAEILAYMGYEDTTDFVVGDLLDGNGPYFIEWNHGDAQPTEQEVFDAKLAMDAAWVAADEDRRWAVVRKERNAALTASDWTQLADSPLDAGQKSAYAVWRDDLRDLPQDYPAIGDAETQLPILIAAEPTV